MSDLEKALICWIVFALLAIPFFLALACGWMS